MGKVLVGPLARAILDRYQSSGWALIAQVLERTRVAPAASGAEFPAVTDGMIFDERDLARESVSSDDWVTIGLVRRGPTVLFVEVCLRSGDARLLFPPDDWSIARPWNGLAIPADAFLELGERATFAHPAGRASGPTDETYAPASGRATGRLTAAMDRSAEICRQSELLLQTARLVLANAHRPLRPHVTGAGTTGGV
jgi:hypothetical protein